MESDASVIYLLTSCLLPKTGAWRFRFPEVLAAREALRARGIRACGPNAIAAYHPPVFIAAVL